MTVILLTEKAFITIERSFLQIALIWYCKTKETSKCICVTEDLGLRSNVGICHVSNKALWVAVQLVCVCMAISQKMTYTRADLAAVNHLRQSKTIWGSIFILLHTTSHLDMIGFSDFTSGHYVVFKKKIIIISCYVSSLRDSVKPDNMRTPQK